MGGTHVEVTTLARNAYFLFKHAGPPMQNLEAFRDFTELNLEVSFRIGLESAIGVSNSCDLAWIGLTSKHFR